SRSSSVLHPCYASLACFFFNAPAPTSTYTLSLHDALPISIFRVAGTYRLVLSAPLSSGWSVSRPVGCNGLPGDRHAMGAWSGTTDRKSTRLNSSHVSISYAVFCLKKKKKTDCKTSCSQTIV